MEKRSNCNSLSCGEISWARYLTSHLWKENWKAEGKCNSSVVAATDRKQIKDPILILISTGIGSLFIWTHIVFFREQWRFHNSIKQEATVTLRLEQTKALLQMKKLNKTDLNTIISTGFEKWSASLFSAVHVPCAFTKRAPRLKSYWGYYGNCNLMLLFLIFCCLETIKTQGLFEQTGHTSEV